MFKNGFVINRYYLQLWSYYDLWAGDCSRSWMCYCCYLFVDSKESDLYLIQFVFYLLSVMSTLLLYCYCFTLLFFGRLAQMGIFLFVVGLFCSKLRFLSLNSHSVYGFDWLDFNEWLGRCTVDLSEPNSGSKTSYNFIHHILYCRCRGNYIINHCNFTIFLDLRGGSTWPVPRKDRVDHRYLCIIYY